MVKTLKTLQTENPQPAAKPTESEDEGEYWPLSGMPWFGVVLTKSHANQMAIPAKMHPLLPSAVVPAVLSRGGKSWNMAYNGDRPIKRFDCNWRTFVTDNNLKAGDACVFELEDCGGGGAVVKFRVQILRGDFPPELLERISGETSDAPIVLDDYP